MDQPAPKEGGSSVYRDGFQAAYALYSTCRSSFSVLASTQFTYRYVDSEQGWHLEASGPIIEVDPTRRKPDGSPVVKSVRHNDLDRIGYLPPYNVQGEAASVSNSPPPHFNTPA